LFDDGLKDLCREYDYVARMGGGEFVIIVPGLQAAGIQQKVLLLEMMAQQVGREICGEDLLSVSVGHAIFKEGNADAEHLLCEADRQMYIIKKQHHSEPRYTREMLNFGAHAGRVN